MIPLKINLKKMNKAKYISIAILTLFLFQNISNSQVKFSLGPSAGITIPSGDYGGTTLNYYSGTSFGLSSGFNVGAILKANLPVISFRLGINYSSLKNTGNSEPGQGSVDVKQSFFMISAGPEYAINIPASPIKPYLGLDLLMTSFSGQTTFQGVSRVPSGTYDMSSASRIGLGFGAGVGFAIGKKMSLDVGFRYNFHNLFGKSFTGTDDRLSSYTSLNDDKDPVNPSDLDKHPIGSSRSITTIQFNLGFLFGL